MDPVPVKDFGKHVNHMHSNDDYLFSEEYSVSEAKDASICIIMVYAQSCDFTRYLSLLTDCRTKPSTLIGNCSSAIQY